ncbi:MAG: F0F1 ATP synthase subunit gamma [Chloroflexi bacterium 13_1_40CM_55_7]|jgi:F-type H+-transporting ATPase subunit gamma|nr:MAG: F0F1 ATP synthase subunit gamma [Chloroflexi bacterium 13_1_40CM_55_7]OLD16909.1 MAG: F0F1 ATP synthase subunit gamma [Acidobacteriales bacterium 13_1_40CM_3_55_5]
MPNILDIRRRIRSVTNTRQITKAMKMVSAAKLRRAQERALAARPYAQMLVNVLKSLVSRVEIYDPVTGEPRHPLLAQRPENDVLLIVVTGDKGLAGAFNTNILKAALRFLQTKEGKNIEIETIGRKGRDFLRRRYPTSEPEKSGPEKSESQERPAIAIVGEQVGVLNKVDYAMASELAGRVIDRYSNGEIDSVYLLYNEFKSMIAQRLIVEQVLPIEQIGEAAVRQAEEMGLKEKKQALEAAREAGVGIRPADTREIDAAAAKFATAPVDYIYEQPPEELFRSLLPKYVGIQIFRALQESVAAEHAARMTAMDAATNNATDMIDSLTLAMNRARQAKITKEIIEIVSGAAAQ